MPQKWKKLYRGFKIVNIGTRLVVLGALHFSATRAASQPATNNAILQFEQPAIIGAAGSRVDIKIMVGAWQGGVENLFGIAFDVRYTDDAFLTIDEATGITAGPFLQPDIFTFFRNDRERRVISIAISRKRGARGQNGTGALLTVPLLLNPAATPGWRTCFSIQNIVARDPEGSPIAIDAGASTCLEIAAAGIDVSPNPFTPNNDGYNDQVFFTRSAGGALPGSITIMDRNGRTIRALQPGQNAWDGVDSKGKPALPGVYLYLVRNKQNTVARGLLALVR